MVAIALLIVASILSVSGLVIPQAHNMDVHPNVVLNLTAFQQDCIDSHNAVRRPHNLPDLTYDYFAETHAIAWAKNLSQIKKLIHGDHPGMAQNIGHPFYSCSAIVKPWSKEGRCGHTFNIMHARTVGCGVVQGWFVCNYHGDFSGAVC